MSIQTSKSETCDTGDTSMTHSQLLRSFVVIFALALCLGQAVLFAQYTTASLSGFITDPSGRPVPGAKVTVENVGTGLVRAFTTSEDGSYLFPALPVGAYRLIVETAGFSKYTQEGITLDVNQTVTQSVSLRVGALTEQVNVAANAEM